VPQDHNLPAAELSGIIFKGHTLELSNRGRNFPPDNELFRSGLNILRDTAAGQVYDPKVEMGLPIKTRGKLVQPRLYNTHVMRRMTAYIKNIVMTDKTN
jgi:hypothetical protein